MSHIVAGNEMSELDFRGSWDSVKSVREGDFDLPNKSGVIKFITVAPADCQSTVPPNWRRPQKGSSHRPDMMRAQLLSDIGQTGPECEDDSPDDLE